MVPYHHLKQVQVMHHQHLHHHTIALDYQVQVHQYLLWCLVLQSILVRLHHLHHQENRQVHDQDHLRHLHPYQHKELLYMVHQDVLLCVNMDHQQVQVLLDFYRILLCWELLQNHHLNHQVFHQLKDSYHHHLHQWMQL